MNDRQHPIGKPADERTADQSTQSASGLNELPPRSDAAPTDGDDVVARERTGDEEPSRRYDEDVEKNRTLPDDGDTPTLRTEI
jgi:hypothetical protein